MQVTGASPFSLVVGFHQRQVRDIHVRKYLVLIFMVLLVVLVPINAGAESIERANHKDIEMLLDAASGMNSAYWASLIGETRGRVYIEYETAVHAGSLFTKEMKRVVYWLPRSEVTDEELEKFKTYKKKFEPEI